MLEIWALPLAVVMWKTAVWFVENFRKKKVVNGMVEDLLVDKKKD